MARTCTVCRHPERGALDALLVEGRASFRELAGRYELSASALRRHKLQHLPTVLVQATQAATLTRSDSLLGHVQRLQDRSVAILQKAEISGDDRTALAALREMRGILELLARLAIRNGEVIPIAVVKQYVDKVLHVLYEFVPEERLGSAMAKLERLIEDELLPQSVPAG